MTLQERVDYAMAKARENGFNMADLNDPTAIAEDLMEYDVDFEKEDPKIVIECCRNWLNRNR
jgi:uncharacterized protein YmfQ (DUF2313 family)